MRAATQGTAVDRGRTPSVRPERGAVSGGLRARDGMRVPARMDDGERRPQQHLRGGRAGMHGERGRLRRTGLEMRQRRHLLGPDRGVHVCVPRRLHRLVNNEQRYRAR